MLSAGKCNLPYTLLLYIQTIFQLRTPQRYPTSYDEGRGVTPQRVHTRKQERPPGSIAERNRIHRSHTRWNLYAFWNAPQQSTNRDWWATASQEEASLFLPAVTEVPAVHKCI